MDILDTIREQIASNPVLIYMKGSPDQPPGVAFRPRPPGFSWPAVNALRISTF